MRRKGKIPRIKKLASPGHERPLVEAGQGAKFNRESLNRPPAC